MNDDHTIGKAATNAKRVTYKDAGAAGRATLRWASYADPALRSSELRVVMAVVSMTALFSKTRDGIALSQIADEANLHPKTVSRVLRGFRDRTDCPIEYQPGRGREVCSVVTIKTSKRESRVVPFYDSKKGAETGVGDAEKGTEGAIKGNRVTGESVPSELDLPSKRSFSEKERSQMKINPNCPACGPYDYDCHECSGYIAASPARRRSA